MKILALSLAAALCMTTTRAAFANDLFPYKAFEKEGDDDWDDDFSDDDWDHWTSPVPASMKLINSKQWDVLNISTIEVAYSIDCITVSPSTTQDIILKEYLSEDNSTYDAKTSVSNSVLKIETGARPQSYLNGYRSRIELYIPSNFNGAVNLTNKVGSISISGITATTITVQSENSSIDVSDSSGTLDCKTLTGCISASRISAPMITLQSQNGQINVSDFSGTSNCKTETGGISVSRVSDSMITLLSQNGQIKVTEFSGTLNCETETGGIAVDQSNVTGRIHTQSGMIDLKLSEIQGNLDVSAETGSIATALPETSAFTVSAFAEIGTITNDFTETWTVAQESVNSAALTGTWGKQPDNQISLATNNGSIKIYPYSNVSESK